MGSSRRLCFAAVGVEWPKQSGMLVLTAMMAGYGGWMVCRPCGAVASVFLSLLDFPR